jgi:epoxyqueuosine reductase
MNPTNRNYQLELDNILKNLNGRPSLLLHACCAPCSSYCIEYLSKYFDITLYFYNPNIESIEEYDKRYGEFVKIVNKFQGVKTVYEKYDQSEWTEKIKGFENCKEGGDRCTICYRLRLEKAMEYAIENNFNYFASTLSISPYKNAKKLNDIGEEISKNKEILYLVNDFKKKGGYLRSIQLSKELNLYRQNYCGCVYSMGGKNKISEV